MTGSPATDGPVVRHAMIGRAMEDVPMTGRLMPGSPTPGSPMAVEPPFGGTHLAAVPDEPTPGLRTGAVDLQHAPRTRRLGRHHRARATRPASRHRCMVLACGTDDTTAVDLGTGAVVRLRVDWSDEHEPDLSPFDVVDADWAGDPQRDDLAQPEALTVEGIPAKVGELRGRTARRVLKHLVAPPEQHLLGFAGSAAPYWEFHGMRPSVALVVPSRGPVLFRRRADESVWARFGWPRSDNWLPVEDRRAMAALWASRRDRLSGKDLAGALGFRPHFVVVTLSRPRDGHCYKTVAALLPRP